MAVEILTVGDELLRGELVDSNSAWLAEQLELLGLPVSRMTSCGDALDPLVATIRERVGRSRLLIISGGLGPTVDDRTTEAVAEVAGVELRRDDAQLAELKAKFAKVGLPFTDNNEKQVWFPQGARVIENDRGTAPAFELTVGECLLICLPGVPRELMRIFVRQLRDRLAALPEAHPGQSAKFKLFGIAEAQVDAQLRKLEIDPAGCEVSLHYRATFPEIHVTVIARGPTEAAERVVAAYAQAIRAEVASRIFAEGEDSFPAAVVRALRAKRATVALAESCTGGLAAEMLTQVPGSSAVFDHSTICYSSASKQQILGVSKTLLDEHGAVSQPCVEQMARAIREISGATYGVAISGIAGPDGGTADKPVGTVHFAIAGPDGTRHLLRQFGYDRARNKLLAAYVGLWLVLDQTRAELRDGATFEDPLGGRWKPRPEKEKR